MATKTTKKAPAKVKAPLQKPAPETATTTPPATDSAEKAPIPPTTPPADDSAEKAPVQQATKPKAPSSSQDKTPPMKSYNVISAVRCYGKDFPEGSTIDLNDHDAAGLLHHKAVELPDAGK